MKRFLSLAAVVGAGLVAVNATAIPTLTLTVDGNLPPGTTSYVLGAIDPDHPANATSEVDAINAILALSLGGSGTSGGNTIYRSQNTFGSLPAATLTGTSGTGTATSFIDSGYTYLVAKYDGPNGVTEVWDLAGVAAGTQITIPANAFGDNNNQYGLSGWNFFNQITTNITSVPDGGSTVALLGLALAGAEALRRKMQK
ncbi:MAG: VPDSG-CTERM sorting domain-containing protein [Limisphaerales bacterium]